MTSRTPSVHFPELSVSPSQVLKLRKARNLIPGILCSNVWIFSFRKDKNYSVRSLCRSLNTITEFRKPEYEYYCFEVHPKIPISNKNIANIWGEGDTCVTYLKALQLNEGAITNLKKCSQLIISFVQYNTMPGRMCEIVLLLAVWWG
jgi:hypothetical protein